MQELRSTILTQTDRLASRSRFGLFSHPPPLYLGDDSPSKKKIKLRDSSGKPITQPKNITTINNKGVSHKDLFSYTPVNSRQYQSDKYIDPQKRDTILDTKFYRTQAKHQGKFKIAAVYKKLNQGPYQHIDQNNPKLNPKRNRNPDGMVITQNKNISVSSHSRINYTYFNKQNFLNIGRQKLKQPPKTLNKNISDQVFKPTNFGKTFCTDRQIYQKTNNPVLIKSRSSYSDSKYNHQHKFKPSSGPRNQTFSKHQYISDPIRITRKRNLQKKDEFKPMSIAKSKPSPSISLNKLNLKIH